MNSNSKNFADPCNQNDPENCHKPHKIEKQEFVLLKVGNPQLTVASANSVLYTLATLPLKTGCLDDPEIKIDFTANIIPNAAASGTALTLQVNKFFINPFNPLISVPVGPSWNYTTTTNSDIISFFVEDTDTFDGAIVKYTVTAITTALASGATVTFNNGTLAATIADEK